MTDPIPTPCAHAFPIGPPYSAEQPGDCERCGRSWAGLSDRQQQVMSQGRYQRDPEATPWPTVRAELGFTPAEEQDIAGRADVLRAEAAAYPRGTFLAFVLAEQGVSQADLARRTNLSTKHINLLCQGTARMSVDVALRLEFVLGVDAADWMAAYTEAWIAEQRDAVHLAVFQEQLKWWKQARGDDLDQIGRLSEERDGLVERLAVIEAACAAPKEPTS